MREARTAASRADVQDEQHVRPLIELQRPARPCAPMPLHQPVTEPSIDVRQDPSGQRQVQEDLAVVGPPPRYPRQFTPKASPTVRQRHGTTFGHVFAAECGRQRRPVDRPQPSRNGPVPHPPHPSHGERTCRRNTD